MRFRTQHDLHHRHPQKKNTTVIIITDPDLAKRCDAFNLPLPFPRLFLSILLRQLTVANATHNPFFAEQRIKNPRLLARMTFPAVQQPVLADVVARINARHLVLRIRNNEAPFQAHPKPEESTPSEYSLAVGTECNPFAGDCDDKRQAFRFREIHPLAAACQSFIGFFPTRQPLEV